MAITKCSAGHYYDNDRYASCPYCNRNQASLDFSESGKTVPLTGVGMDSAADTDNCTIPLTTPDTSEIGKTVPLSSYVGRDVSGSNPTVPPQSGVMGGRKLSDDQATVYGGLNDGCDPVVGWLVCVDGPSKGKDFRLYFHINTIGRGTGNKVCIPDDKGISRESHARVAYDPAGNAFRLLPGETNTVYLNGTPVYTPELLKAYDQIRMGKTTLLFVPFCCDQFVWPEN